MDIVIDVINFLIESAAKIISLVLIIFPDSPFLTMQNIIPNNVKLSYITWFIPFPAMLVHFTALLGAIAIYYVVRILARWLKMVRG